MAIMEKPFPLDIQTKLAKDSIGQSFRAVARSLASYRGAERDGVIRCIMYLSAGDPQLVPTKWRLQSKTTETSSTGPITTKMTARQATSVTPMPEGVTLLRPFATTGFGSMKPGRTGTGGSSGNMRSIDAAAMEAP